MMKKLGIDVDYLFPRRFNAKRKRHVRTLSGGSLVRSTVYQLDVSAVGFEGANVFESEDSHSYGIFSRGMNRVSESGMFNRSGLDINSNFVRTDMQKLHRCLNVWIISSLFIRR